jgi:Holliday junction resolvase RusA-like endonuclease
MSQDYVFRLEGKIKPYVRMTQRSKGVEAQAMEYMANKQALQYQFKAQMMEHNWGMLPEKTALYLELEYSVAERLHGFDLDNVLKAVSDAMQAIVIGNDLWIDRVRAERRLGDRFSAVVKVGVVKVVG